MTSELCATSVLLYNSKRGPTLSDFPCFMSDLLYTTVVCHGVMSPLKSSYPNYIKFLLHFATLHHVLLSGHAFRLLKAFQTYCSIKTIAHASNSSKDFVCRGWLYVRFLLVFAQLLLICTFEGCFSRCQAVIVNHSKWYSTVYITYGEAIHGCSLLSVTV